MNKEGRIWKGIISGSRQSMQSYILAYTRFSDGLSYAKEHNQKRVYFSPNKL